MCSDESLRHFGKMGLLGVTDTVKFPLHAAQTCAHCPGGRASPLSTLDNCLCSESDCSHCVLRNNRIAGPEMALGLSGLPLPFADGATDPMSRSWLVAAFYKQGCSILSPDHTPLHHAACSLGFSLTLPCNLDMFFV